MDNSGVLEGVVVREALPADVDGMMAMERTAETAAHWREEEYRKLFEGGAVERLALVATEHGRVAGFIVTADVGGEWELENVVVGGQWRGQGLGRRLVKEFLLVARQRGGRVVFLEVRESNAAARGLYAKSGFQEAGRRKAYYSAPEEDAVVYRLDLGGDDFDKSHKPLARKL